MQNDKSIQLNKREQFAIRILAGMLANPENTNLDDEHIAQQAVEIADHLIVELRKRPPAREKPDEFDE